ncbi:unnamed protein product (macronuclear) [Paramecium tetraurelia]|uniref:CRAL-TRIO domain-containing protein n=1 Tax=Paramecium tetraurelia TaxID=5888 RepID=A0CIG4_PARTE|nr:uncharacterized protein GSPATT00007716001 [Paramecium tetraurelia]CAK70581.1 unnamed protein product [Paramecium tetraurelia]|eukprot:XP_001437978.1 hypothetical protein (macronuclear) [Paramecium tetraurelia strain d4-2]
MFVMVKRKEFKEEIKKANQQINLVERKAIIQDYFMQVDPILKKCQMNTVIYKKKHREHILWRYNRIYDKINTQSNHFQVRNLLPFGPRQVIQTNHPEFPFIDQNRYITFLLLAQHDKELFYQALSFLLGIVQKWKLGHFYQRLIISEVKVCHRNLRSIDRQFDYYLGYLKRMFILNPSSGIKFLFQQIKTFLNPQTINKISSLSQRNQIIIRIH